MSVNFALFWDSSISTENSSRISTIYVLLWTLTKKNVVYTWTPESQSFIDKIKAILNSDLLLTHFDPRSSFLLKLQIVRLGQLSHIASQMDARSHLSRKLLPDTTTEELQPD
ncbi:hypothetical protein RB195_026497 [Necator americanus]|uniref:Reverse transcriptase/retrotransposon-derived protein RNase H-like domain-containing protein n=1 Tax=Necator americanus TaxID=51031 RepID=A0ABR1EX75_NECAM